MAFDYQGAKTAGYSDDEINAYLAKKNLPQALTQPTGTPSGGIGEKIGSLLMGLIRPEKELVTKTAQSLGEQIKTGKYKTQTPMDILAAAGGPLGQLFAPTEIGKATRETKFDIASLMVPFGKGAKPLTKVLLPGAVAGGLYEAGKEGATPTSIAGSAALGTAGAAILPKVMGAGKKLIGIEKGIQKGIIQPQAGTKATSFAQEEKAIDELVAVGEKYGVPIKGSAQNIRKVSSELYDKIYKKIADVLQKSTKGIGVTRAKTGAKKFLEESGEYFVTGNPTHERWYQTFANRADKLATNKRLTASAVLKWKSQVSEGLSRAFDKVNGTIQSPLTDKEQVGLDMWKYVNDLLSSLEPKIKPLMTDQHVLNEAGLGLKKSAESMFIFPAIGKIPGAMQPAQALASKIGEVAGIAGRGMEAIVPEGAVTAPITSRIGAQAQRVIEAKPKEKRTGDEFLQSIGLPTLSEYQESIKPVGKSDRITPEELSMAHLSLPTEQAAAIQKAFDAQKGSSEEQKKARAKETAERIITVMENLYFSEGLASGRIGGVGARLGAMAGAKPKLSAYLRARDMVRPTFARTMGDVGNLSAPEQENAVKLMPNEFSTEEEAQNYFSYMRAILGLPQRQ